jgi:hypothetical protein
MKKINDNELNNTLAIGNAIYYINQAHKFLQYASLEIDNIKINELLQDINDLKKILFNIDAKITDLKNTLNESEEI